MNMLNDQTHRDDTLLAKTTTTKKSVASDRNSKRPVHILRCLKCSNDLMVLHASRKQSNRVGIYVLECGNGLTICVGVEYVSLEYDSIRDLYTT